MPTPVFFENHERPTWLPPGATAVRASGSIHDGPSLTEEYQPTPERLAQFQQYLSNLRQRELETLSDAHDIRI